MMSPMHTMMLPACVAILLFATTGCTITEAFQMAPLFPAATTTLRNVVVLQALERVNGEAKAENSVSNNIPPAGGEEQNDEDSSILLIEALDFFNSSSATKLLSQIMELRDSNQKNPGQMEDFLNSLLSNGPDSSKLPLWSRFRPLSRISKRAKLRSLRRLLDLSTPPPSEEQQEGNEELTKQRRRRALVSVLRSLSADDNSSRKKVPAVVILEKRARQATLVSESEDIKGRMPEGLETPKYSVISQKKASRGNTFEIRRYEPFSVCSVAMNQARPVNSEKTDAKVSMPQLSGASSFGALAGYLFGKNQDSKAMKMTTPVLMSGEGTNKQMSFVLPSEYWGSGVESAPKPFAESGVQVQEMEGCERATLMYGGFSSKKEVERRKKQLLAALAKDNEWDAVADEPVSTAQYNDPFTPPWKRLNEVSIRVVARS